MRNDYAENFYEILDTLKIRIDLMEDVKNLIRTKNIVGKALEGGNRKEIFKDILILLVEGKIDLEESYNLVEEKIPRHTSPYRDNNRVFSDGWGERLVRTNLSKFYNQAILIKIVESGSSVCFIPHSAYENPDSECSRIAGSEYDAKVLLDRLMQSYEENNFTNEFKIPNHPHCTHVVMPVID